MEGHVRTKGERTRADLVAAATRMHRNGEVPTLQSLSEAVGKGTATVYYHFPDGLEALDQAVALQAAAKLTSAMDAAAAMAYGIEAVEAVINAAADWVRNHPQLFRLLHMHADRENVRDGWLGLRGPLDAALVEAEVVDADAATAFVAGLTTLVGGTTAAGGTYLLDLLQRHLQAHSTSSSRTPVNGTHVRGQPGFAQLGVHGG